MNKIEVFKDVPNYVGTYMVSNHGNVVSLNYGGTKEVKTLKPGIDSRGYYCVVLCNKGNRKTFNIHKLVAIVFLDHTPKGHKEVVDHIDNDKKNNHIGNLQLISNRENTSKDRGNGSSNYIGVFWHKHGKKWMSAITINGNQKYLGLFSNEYSAHLAYRNELKKLK
jgi:hypothetical protein